MNLNEMSVIFVLANMEHSMSCAANFTSASVKT
jgi:hypothetical protein